MNKLISTDNYPYDYSLEPWQDNEWCFVCDESRRTIYKELQNVINARKAMNINLFGIYGTGKSSLFNRANFDKGGFDVIDLNHDSSKPLDLKNIVNFIGKHFKNNWKEINACPWRIRLENLLNEVLRNTNEGKYIFRLAAPNIEDSILTLFEYIVTNYNQILCLEIYPDLSEEDNEVESFGEKEFLSAKENHATTKMEQKSSQIKKYYQVSKFNYEELDNVFYDSNNIQCNTCEKKCQYANKKRDFAPSRLGTITPAIKNILYQWTGGNPLFLHLFCCCLNDYCIKCGTLENKTDEEINILLEGFYRNSGSGTDLFDPHIKKMLNSLNKEYHTLVKEFPQGLKIKDFNKLKKQGLAYSDNDKSTHLIRLIDEFLKENNSGIGGQKILLAAFAALFWARIKNHTTKEFVDEFRKELGEDLAKEIFDLLKRSCEIAAIQTEEIDQLQKENGKVKNLILNALEKSELKFPDLPEKLRIALKSILQKETFIFRDDIDIIAIQLGYSLQELGTKPHERADYLVNRASTKEELDKLIDKIYLLKYIN